MSAGRLSAVTLNNVLLSGLGRFSEGRSAALQALSPAGMPASWADADDRAISVEEHLRTGIAWQVRVNREERGLTQDQLAALMGTKQSAVSKLEDPDGGDIRLSTLTNVAHAFDCALVVRLVPFSEFAVSIADTRPDRMVACAYADEAAPRAKVLAADLTNTLE